MIRKEALVGEATTVRLGGEDVNFNKNDIDEMKGYVKEATGNIADIIASKSNDNRKMSKEEAREQAEKFMRNYLKGVYGK